MALTLGILFIGVNKIADGLNPLIVGACSNWFKEALLVMQLTQLVI